MREREFASFPLELAQMSAKGGTMEGYASVFNYPIESGKDHTTFVRPGAFTKTLKENRSQIQVLFNHGIDPRYGLLPIGTASVMQEDRKGLWTEVQLHDGPDNENIRAALASGSLRAQSIQFETMQESANDERTERYIEQVRLWEFGPVTFPANDAATATLHSLAGLATLLGEVHWDGAAAMRTCSNAAEFRKIAFERNNDSDPDTAAHWTLPHHPHWRGAPGNADPAGVAAALAALHGGRGGPPDLKQSVASVESHLTAHQSEASSGGRATGQAGTPSQEDRLTRWLIDKGQLSERALKELAGQEAWLKRAGRDHVGS